MIETKAAFAVRMGVDRSQPTRWSKRGMPVLSDGRIDVEPAEAWVKRTIDSSQRRSHSRKRGMSAPAAPAKPFDCMAHLDLGRRAIVTAMMDVAEGVPSIAAVAAADLGLAVDVARRIFDLTATEARMWVTDLLDETDIAPPPGFERWNKSPLPAGIKFLKVTDDELAEYLEPGGA